MLLSPKKQVILVRLTGWVTFLLSVFAFHLLAFAFIRDASEAKLDQVDTLFFLLVEMLVGSVIFYSASTLFSSPWKKAYKLMLKSSETDTEN